MQSDYGQNYLMLWERHWWWRARERHVVGRLKEIAKTRTLNRILDVGCGDGLFFHQLSQFAKTVDGLEPDPNLVRNPNVAPRITIGALDSTFRPASPYDLIVMLDVIEHIEDDLEALRIARRSLQPGGRLLITVPALPWLWSEHDEVNHHYRRYTRTELVGKLDQAGFRVDAARYFFGWTVGPLWLRSRLYPSRDRTNPISNRYRVTIPNPVVNKVLEGLSRLDHWLGTFVSWPLGSSLIALATFDQTNPISSGKPFSTARRNESNLRAESLASQGRIG